MMRSPPLENPGGVPCTASVTKTTNTTTNVRSTQSSSISVITVIKQLQAEVKVLRELVYQLQKDNEEQKVKHKEEINSIMSTIEPYVHECILSAGIPRNQHSIALQCNEKQAPSQGAPSKQPTKRNATRPTVASTPLRQGVKKTYASVLVHTNVPNKNPLDLLRQTQPNPDELGVKDWKKFSRNSAILAFQNKEKADEFNKKASQLGIAVKVQSKKPYELRIHRLPMDTTEIYLKSQLLEFTGENVTVKIIKYKTIDDSLLGIIECSKMAFDKLRTVKYLSIRWEKCPIDTKPILMKCKTCGLLGHTPKNCQGPINIDPEHDGPVCPNCYQFNKLCQQNGRPKNHWRSTNHDINYVKCPTRKAYLRKYINARKQNDDKDDIIRNISTERMYASTPVHIAVSSANTSLNAEISQEKIVQPTLEQSEDQQLPPSSTPSEDEEDNVSNIEENSHMIDKEPSSPSSDMSEQCDNVDAIIGRRKTADGTFEYLVKWKEYEPSWELSTNLNCPKLIEDYNQVQPTHSTFIGGKEIECITRKRYLNDGLDENGKLFGHYSFYVKFKGYHYGHNIWVSEHDLDTGYIKEYLEIHPLTAEWPPRHYT